MHRVGGSCTLWQHGRHISAQGSIREVMELAAALEIESEHPLADAILKFAAETLGQTLKLPGMLARSGSLSPIRCLQAVKPRVRSVSMDKNKDCCAGPAGKSGRARGREELDGSMGARKVDWVRPAQDITVVAGEQPASLVHRVPCTLAVAADQASAGK